MQFRGDVDGDGKITIMDAQILFMYKSSELSLTDDELSRADSDGDGEATLADALLMIKHIAGLYLIDEVIT